MQPALESLEPRLLLAGAAVSFAAPQAFAVGTGPQSLAAGDLNGDGKSDLVVGNYDNGGVSVLLNNGDGTFRRLLTYVSASGPHCVALADVNGDGKLDLVATEDSASANKVLVALGNGNGTFQAAVEYPVGAKPYSVAIGDFNGDGHPDLAVANYTDSTVSILLGAANGDGTFQAKTDYFLGYVFNPKGIVVGDFNGDGHSDLAVADSGCYQVSVLLGNGDGTFKPNTNYNTGALALAVAVGDFNGDGKADLAAVTSSTATILRSQVDGTFVVGTPVAVGANATWVSVGDFNGDGKADLAVVNSFSNNVSLLLGQGNATFQPGVKYPVGQGPYGAAVGDFNGDGRSDLAVANEQGDTVTVLMGNGDGTLQTWPVVSIGAGTNAMVVGDFNHDGKSDVAVAGTYPPHGVTVLLGNGDNTFQAGASYPLATMTQPSSMVAGDFNNDGNSDLAVVNLVTNTVSILMGHADGTFQAAKDYAIHENDTYQPYGMVVGDFNGDGKSDLAIASFGYNTISILLGYGDGTFQASRDFPLPYSPLFLAAADFNGDGKLDLATSGPGNTVNVLLGNGNGTFSNGPSLPIANAAMAGVVGDFNGDGHADLAVINLDYSHVFVLLGNGDGAGTFQASKDYYLGYGFCPEAIALGDFNGDGHPDLATADAGTSMVSILAGAANGDGTFQTPIDYQTCVTPYFLSVGDFNSDGKSDLAVIKQFGSALNILTNTAAGPVAAAVTPSGEQRGDVSISYTLADSQSNPTDIQVQYSLNSGVNWFAATAGAGGDGTSGLSSSPGGTSHTYVWNSAADLGPMLDINVQIRIASSNVAGANAGDPTGNFTVNNRVNAPAVVNTSIGSLAYTENATAKAIDSGLTVSDVDDTTLSSAVVRISAGFQTGQDVLGFVNQNGIAGTYDASMGVLSLTGTATVGRYQAALRTVTYRNTSENPSPADRTIAFAADDGFGQSNPASRTIAVTAVNDPPVNTVPAAGSQTVNEDTDLNFYAATGNAIRISDVDGCPPGAGAALEKVTLTGSKGLLTLGQWSGLSLTTGDGWADATMTFTGTLADINAALDGLTFRGLANYNGPASLQITTCDLGNTGTGGAHSDTDTVAITVKSVYDPPTVAGRLKSLPQGGTLKFALADFAAGFTTVEAGKSLRKIQITSLPADGTLKLSGTAVAVGQEIAAASLPYLSYTPAAGYAGPDSFGWNGADGLSYAAIPATMNIVQQPTAAAFSRSFVLNTPLGFAQADFTTAFTDPSPGYSLGTVKITSLPIHGTLKLGGASVKLNQVIPLSQLDSLAYTPTTGFRGSDSFGWNGSDGRLYATTAAVVKLSYFDRPPVVADIAKSTPQNHLKALTFAAADFTGAAAFSDPDADSIQKVKITSLPANGLLKYLGVPVTVGKEITAGMIHYLTYTPTSGYLGPDSFGWNGSDGTQYAANPASVNLSVS